MSMYAEERQQAMAQLVAERGRLSVTELASEFDVTTETVRRDLSALERMGLVRRVHGGAVPASSLTVIEPGLGERDSANTAAEGADRQGGPRPAAARRLHRPDRRRLHHRTASPASSPATTGSSWSPTPSRSPPGSPGLPQIELHLLPGRVRPTTQAAVGADTVAALADLRADVAFIGTNGISVGHGLSTPDRDEAATKRAMVAAARQVVVLADASKIGARGLGPVRPARRRRRAGHRHRPRRGRPVAP